jgi:AraC-like DNA-binding protein
MQELLAIVKRHARHIGLNPTRVPEMLIMRSAARAQPVHTVQRPSLCFLVQGTKEVTVAGRVYRYTAGECLVSTVDLPVTGEIIEASEREPYLCLVIALEPALVHEVLQSSGIAVPARSRPGLFVEPAVPALRDAVSRLARCLDSPGDCAVLASGILREIIYRLLQGPFGATVAELGLASSRTQRISRAIAHLKNRFAEPLRVEEVARLAGMSPSTFHEHFRKITTMSPLQYQKQLRLQEARRLLASDGAGAADIGFRVGYQSPSQFSREYARHFGHSPTTDMRKGNRLAPIA